MFLFMCMGLRIDGNGFNKSVRKKQRKEGDIIIRITTNEKNEYVYEYYIY